MDNLSCHKPAVGRALIPGCGGRGAVSTGLIPRTSTYQEAVQQLKAALAEGCGADGSPGLIDAMAEARGDRPRHILVCFAS